MDYSVYPLSTHGCVNGVWKSKGIRKGDIRKIYNFFKYLRNSKILNQQFWGTLKFPDTNAKREWWMFYQLVLPMSRRAERTAMKFGTGQRTPQLLAPFNYLCYH